eukprot:scaffold397027_cov31-Prasinocladus_malaysianus.AAC.1
MEEKIPLSLTDFGLQPRMAANINALFEYYVFKSGGVEGLPALVADLTGFNASQVGWQFFSRKKRTSHARVFCFAY